MVHCLVNWRDAQEDSQDSEDLPDIIGFGYSDDNKECMSKLEQNKSEKVKPDCPFAI